ncbi:pyocin activator PrtN family protein [Pseudomonas putida]|uniref:pyocin activator PrtN family protein n=1 Tax=Pseudomonas putida TaxID=303 RepID=UPI0039059E50
MFLSLRATRLLTAVAVGLDYITGADLLHPVLEVVRRFVRAAGGQRKVLAGQIKLPITRLEASQKSARGIHIADLAHYLDQQREAARKECAQLNKTLRAG